jgi:(p)ppGpp synthase/HD superfamily hydrolase
MTNLISEQRTNKNGVTQIRHVKSGESPSKSALKLPQPLLETRNTLRTLSLKDIDSGGLTLALLSSVRDMEREGGVNYETVLNALDKATFLHRDQTRGNRKNLRDTPYIEHPLRNALRSIRWGCKDQDIIVAIILHDTVEDCADDIVRHSTGGENPESMTEAQKRDAAMEWVTKEFGPEAARLVLAVSNPVSDGTKRTAQQKREEYADHVGSVIAGDAKVFLVKVADFVDNASGLHHNNIEENREAVAKRARKYLLVLSIFEEELAANEGIRDLIDEDGYRDIVKQLERTRSRLEAMV